MALSEAQISNLLEMVAVVESDELDCDGCVERIAEFADLHLTAREIPDAMQAVKTHLEQCPCCQDEFKALLNGLAAIEA